MKILNLNLKKQWFDMIASGEKTEEYREIKPYWINRICWHEFHFLGPDEIIREFKYGIPILKSFVGVMKI